MYYTLRQPGNTGVTNSSKTKPTGGYASEANNMNTNSIYQNKQRAAPKSFDTQMNYNGGV